MRCALYVLASHTWPKAKWCMSLVRDWDLDDGRCESIAVNKLAFGLALCTFHELKPDTCYTKVSWYLNITPKSNQFHFFLSDWYYVKFSLNKLFMWHISWL